MFNLKNFKFVRLDILSLLSIAVFAAAGYAQNIEENLFKEMKWRCIGPANFSGRIVDVEALDNDFRHVVVASASGGVWKSVNAGTTWEPIFDNYGSASIGDIAIFQKDPNVIWVGTGEANNRNSVAWGDGIYKSTDGGATFKHMGLEDTYQIARVVTHPKDDDVVYVAAIGYLWGYIGDRGLYKTTNGGKTWEKLTNGLPDDGKTGAIDLVIDPNDANTLYVAFYQRLRKPYRFDSGGPNGKIFKSTDGGASWVKLTKGLPEGDTGRIGLAIYHANPRILMAIIEHGFRPREDEKDYYNMKLLGTGIYRSEDGGKSWKYMNRYNNRPFYYSQIRINPLDDQRVYVLTTTIRLSEDGGKTFIPGGLEFEGGLDYHALWLDPNNKDRYYLGKDKGLTLTHDHGKTFQFFDNMPIGQFYAIGVDMRDPYYVYGGTQDNGTWGGPSFSKDVRGILADSWWKLHWGDGMFVQIDPNDWRKVYTEAENGSFRRYDAETREVEFSRPNPQNIVNYQEYVTEVDTVRRNRLPRQFRFNWRSPLVMSPHNAQTLYLGGNHLFETVDGGHHWQIISPDLSTNNSVKMDTLTGGLTRDATGAETHCSITSLSVSPLTPSLIWVGTDDGNVQISRNGGVTWTNLRENISGVPEGIWVSCIEASHFDEGICYVTFGGHRSADLSTWIFRTTDFGETWTNITNNIPDGQSMYVIREDLKNKNLLFAGSEFAIFASINGGKSWVRFMNNMPTVAFHDLVIHSRDGDLIAGTHGRGIWILDDISPLQQLTEDILDTTAYIFENRPVTLWEDASRGGVRGTMFYAAENPPYIPKRENVVRAKLINGGLLSYYLRSSHKDDVVIEISDITGMNKRTITASGKQGINRALWDLRFDPTPRQTERFIKRLEPVLNRISQLPKMSKEQREALKKAQQTAKKSTNDVELNQIANDLRDQFGHMNVFRRAFRGRLQGERAQAGDYMVNMNVDGEIYTGKITVRNDPMLNK
jgi:photosystem II stability/assembly factor-like uncharacterized protein